MPSCAKDSAPTPACVQFTRLLQALDRRCIVIEEELPLLFAHLQVAQDVLVRLPPDQQVDARHSLEQLITRITALFPDDHSEFELEDIPDDPSEK